MTDKLIYDIIIELQSLNAKSFDNIRNRSASIISFIAVIINLEVLATVQIISKNSVTPFLIFLLSSSIILFISLIFAFLSFRGSPISVIGAQQFIDSYHDKSEKEILENAYATMASNIESNKKISNEKNDYLNNSIFLLILGVFFIILFFFLYVINLF